MNIVDKKLIQEKAALLTKLNRYILVDTDESKKSAKPEESTKSKESKESLDAYESKLTPCYLDRKSFMDIIMTNEQQIMTEDNGIMTQKDNESSSYQAKAYNIFVESMNEELKRIVNPMDGLDLVHEIFRQALDKMSVTRCKGRCLFILLFFKQVDFGKNALFQNRLIAVESRFFSIGT